MNSTVDIIRTDCAVGLQVLKKYLDDSKQLFPVKLQQLCSYFKPTPDDLVSKYIRVYKECKSLSDESISREGPFLTVAQVQGANTKFGVALIEPVENKKDPLFKTNTYVVTGDDELMQLNMRDRHVAIKLMNYGHELEELTSKIRSLMPQIKSVQGEHVGSIPLFTTTGVPDRPGIEHLINSMATVVDFKNNEVEAYLNSVGHMQISRVQVDCFQYSLINYQQNGAEMSTMFIHDLNTGDETHVFMRNKKTLGGLTKGFPQDDIINIVEKTDFKLGIDPIVDHQNHTYSSNGVAATF